MAKEKLISILKQAICEKGYAGMTLSYISEITGLNKSSIYHYFPGGKSEIALEVLKSTEELLSQACEKALKREKKPFLQFCAILDILTEFYKNGESSCLIEMMSINVTEDNLQQAVQSILDKLLGLFKDIFLAAGQAPKSAQKNAVHVLTLLQGSLILSRATQHPAYFMEQVKELKQSGFTSFSKAR